MSEQEKTSLRAEYQAAIKDINENLRKCLYASPQFTLEALGDADFSFQAIRMAANRAAEILKIWHSLAEEQKRLVEEIRMLKHKITGSLGVDEKTYYLQRLDWSEERLEEVERMCKE